MRDETFFARNATEILSAVAPNSSIEVVPSSQFKERAQLELPGTRSVRYAYLDAAPGARLALRLYPADTLTQAKVLYRDPARVAGMFACFVNLR